MSYAEYVIAAYAVFFAVLLWDGLAPRLRLSRIRRSIAARARRAAARPPAS
ncbi:heme exporter protein CcmD [Coralloluteibacterium thermophilus]|uniref:Heme exporter protein D n=1 Tax=Coralloluteibacterium thermophilum TaxID=2707049 RepID=A0ABV9NSJ6_9GAMM